MILFQKPAGSVGCVFARDILSEKDDPTVTDIFGRTALHYAALNRRVDLLPVLYAFGLKLDTEDSKVNCLIVTLLVFSSLLFDYIGLLIYIIEAQIVLYI